MKIELFIKSVADRISRMLPECRFKNSLRSLFYNAFNSDYKMYVLKNGELLIKTMGISFRVSQIPSFEVGNDLISLRGYLSGSKILPGSIVVDAGASASGIATIYFSKMVGDTGKVIALEPDKNNFKILEQNLRMNDIKNVIVINKGLWRNEETLSFNSEMGESSSVLFNNENANASGKQIKIDCVDLDHLLAELGVQRVDFIKMDIEGAEIEALEGMMNTLKTGKPSLAIASYHWRDGKQTYLSLEASFKALGYQTHTGHPIHLTTYAHKT
jgi:FkbM family methyltransferase